MKRIGGFLRWLQDVLELADGAAAVFIVRAGLITVGAEMGRSGEW